MAQMQPTPKPCAPGGGKIEPKSILFVGGPMQGKKRADFGRMQYETPTGGLYRRVRLDAGKVEYDNRVVFDVMAYFGCKYTEQIEGEGA